MDAKRPFANKTGLLLPVDNGLCLLQAGTTG